MRPVNVFLRDGLSRFGRFAAAALFALVVAFVYGIVMLVANTAYYGLFTPRWLSILDQAGMVLLAVFAGGWCYRKLGS